MPVIQKMTLYRWSTSGAIVERPGGSPHGVSCAKAAWAPPANINANSGPHFEIWDRIVRFIPPGSRARTLRKLEREVLRLGFLVAHRDFDRLRRALLVPRLDRVLAGGQSLDLELAVGL